MPSLISKILHKKSSSTSSSSAAPSSPTSPDPSTPHKLQKNPPGTERNRHVSLPPAARTDNGAASDTRRSLDGPRSSPRSAVSQGSPVFHRRQGDGPALVSPTRAAPPPPLPEPSPRSSLNRDTGMRSASLDSPSKTPPSAYLHNSSSVPYAPGSPSSASSAIVTSVGPQGTHQNRQLSTSSLHLPSYSYHPGSSIPQRTGRASLDEPRPAPSSPRSLAGSSPLLPPGAATANPSMHYPQVASPPKSPKSPLERTDLLVGTSRTEPASTNSVKPVQSFVDRPTVAEAPIRRSEEVEMGSLHSPALSSIDSRLLDHPVPPVPPALYQQLPTGQSPYQPQMLAVHDHEEQRSRRSGESRRSRRSIDVPERHSSLSLLQPGGEGALGSVSSFETFGAGPSVATPRASRDKLDDNTRNAELEQKLSALTIEPPQSQTTATADQGARQTSSNTDSTTLDKARADLVDRIVMDSQKRRAARGELSEEAKDVFQRAGLSETLNKGHTVDVKTKWIEPVVKEHIIRQEHTEYTTIIDRDIHRHHVYPKIQPVEDPDPIMLETRHRIFSPATGKWHEVVGDDKARAILGDDVFTNGPKEVRMKRTKAMPGLSPTSPTIPRALPSTNVQDTQVANGLAGLDGLDEDPTEAGFGTGGRGAVEREGVVGEKMSEWRSAERGGIFGRRDSEEVGTAW